MKYFYIIFTLIMSFYFGVVLGFTFHVENTTNVEIKEEHKLNKDSIKEPLDLYEFGFEMEEHYI